MKHHLSPHEYICTIAFMNIHYLICHCWKKKNNSLLYWIITCINDDIQFSIIAPYDLIVIFTISSTLPSLAVKVEAHRKQNWAHFVYYLKIINTFFGKIMEGSWNKMFGGGDPQKCHLHLVGKMVFELLMETIFCMFWSVTQEQLLLLKF